MKKTLAAIAALTALTIAVDARAGVPTSYTIVDLGADVQVGAVNASGRIVGTDLSTHMPVEYANGAWKTLPGATSGGGALAINASGVVAGFAGTKAVEWSGGKLVPLTGTEYSQGVGIGNDGSVVGSYFGGSFEYCYKWKDGAKSYFGLTEGNCWAQAIDTTGTYVGGNDWDDNGDQHAFISSPAGSVDLGTLHSGTTSTLQALNKRGHGAVWSAFDSTGAWAAAFWNGTKLIGIGVHANGTSLATAINDKDELLVVGSDGFGHVLFLYQAHGKVTTPIEPLIANPAGWTFDYAPSVMLKSLAEDGTIYGTANLDGQPHAFKLVPAAS